MFLAHLHVGLVICSFSVKGIGFFANQQFFGIFNYVAALLFSLAQWRSLWCCLFVLIAFPPAFRPVWPAGALWQHTRSRAVRSEKRRAEQTQSVLGNRCSRSAPLSAFWRLFSMNFLQTSVAGGFCADMLCNERRKGEAQRQKPIPRRSALCWRCFGSWRLRRPKFLRFQVCAPVRMFLKKIIKRRGDPKFSKLSTEKIQMTRPTSREPVQRMR